jgi:hypothetical protein
VARQRAVAERTVDTFAEFFEGVVDNVSRVLQGKESAIRLALVCLVS